jgi:hypothetical protein
MNRVEEVAKRRNGSASRLVTVVDEFCASLSTSESRTVRNTVEEIGRLQRQVAVNALAIGDALYKLRTAIGSQEFHRFMREVLPKFGMSRSTAYRWLSFSERLVPLFPNPTVRQYLMAFTDGKGIVIGAKSEGAGDVHLGLTPAAENALKSLPPPPTGKTEIAASEEWVRQFIRATRKARWEARSKRKGPAEARAAIIDMFIRFADRYGLQAAEDLCGDLDKTLTQLVDESSAKAAKPHRVYELGIKSAHSGSGNGQQPFSPILDRPAGNSLT